MTTLPLLKRSLLAVAVAAAALCPALRSQVQPVPDPYPLPSPPLPGHAWLTPPLTDRTNAALDKLRPLIEAKQWGAALDVIQQTIPDTDPSTYDMALLLDSEAKLLLQARNDYTGAIQPWEQMLALCRTHLNFFPRGDIMDTLRNVAELYYQVGSSSKDKAFQRQHLDRAIEYMQAWIKNSRHLAPDAVQFYSTMLYYKAIQDSAHVDQATLDDAEREAQLGLLLTAKPHLEFYQMLIAIAQQKGDLATAAEYLQLLVQYPGGDAAKRGYYEDLVSIYNNLAADAEKNPRQQRVYYALAINTLESAQAAGFMRTPRDNYNLVTLYYAAGQFGAAIDLLHAGLTQGSIEGTRQNWEALSYFLQVEDRNLEAIGVLREAADRYPDSGSIDFTISQIYEGLNRSADAFEYAGRAIAKGNLGNHRFAAYELYAYLGYDLKRYAEALKVAELAAKMPEAKKDPTFPQLIRALQDALQREQQAQEAQTAATGTPPIDAQDRPIDAARTGPNLATISP